MSQYKRKAFTSLCCIKTLIKIPIRPYTHGSRKMQNARDMLSKMKFAAWDFSVI